MSGTATTSPTSITQASGRPRPDQPGAPGRAEQRRRPTGRRWPARQRSQSPAKSGRCRRPGASVQARLRSSRMGEAGKAASEHRKRAHPQVRERGAEAPTQSSVVQARQPLVASAQRLCYHARPCSAPDSCRHRTSSPFLRGSPLGQDAPHLDGRTHAVGTEARPTGRAPPRDPAAAPHRREDATSRRRSTPRRTTAMAPRRRPRSPRPTRRSTGPRRPARSTRTPRRAASRA